MLTITSYSALILVRPAPQRRVVHAGFRCALLTCQLLLAPSCHAQAGIENIGIWYLTTYHRSKEVLMRRKEAHKALNRRVSQVMLQHQCVWHITSACVCTLSDWQAPTWDSLPRGELP